MTHRSWIRSSVPAVTDDTTRELTSSVPLTLVVVVFNKTALVWLLGLVASNLLFGAFGGLLVCMHGDYSLNVGFDDDQREHCFHDCQPPESPRLVTAAACAQCLDMALKDSDDPFLRQSGPRSVGAPTASILVSAPDQPDLAQPAAAAAARRPPPPTEVARLSVVVAQCTVLRI